MQTAQQLDPGVRAQRLEEAAVHAGKINGALARHAAHRIRTGRVMPPSYRQANSSGYAVKGGEVNGYTDDTVVVLGHESARVPATGRTYHSDFAFVFRVRNGKLTAFRAYHDTDAMMRATAA